jgi:hypothetical protein
MFFNINFLKIVRYIRRGVLHFNNSLKPRTIMMEYAKIILPKVSFSSDLFSKELIKCINWIEEENRVEFCRWCKNNFGHMHSKIIKDAFSGVAA